MDPDAALAEIRRITASDDRSITNHDKLIEHFEALDQWLSRGGFLPKAWVPEMGREAKEPKSLHETMYETHSEHMRGI